jgi:hypothetical protein
MRKGVYVDPAASEELRAKVVGWVGEAAREVDAFFGTKIDPPEAIVCASDACAREHAGPTRRSHATLGPPAKVIIAGIDRLTKQTLVHEMIHVEIARRMKGKQALPAWFDEGVATFIGDNGNCPPGTKRAVDDLRSLERSFVWDRFTNTSGRLEQAYCQARDEIGAWTQKHDRRALVAIIDAVSAGKKLDDVYGPLLTNAPASQRSRALDAHFALDENLGLEAADDSGRSHVASLVSGAIWTTGKQGNAVKVKDGSYVRADGFMELGIPDTPFSLGIWVKPLANAKVLVHTAANASGGDGFCVPLLGYDAKGRLVAQLSFDTDPNAFVSVVGPALPLGKWAHVLTSWSADEGLRLYVDGALVGTAPSAHRLAPGQPLYLFFGTDRRAPCWTQSIETGDWNGVVDEIRVWDHAVGAEAARAVARGGTK